eukprot:jgi/Botrbrau1/19793/Bobra.0124s0041.1
MAGVSAILPSDVRDPIHFLEEGTLLYPAGHAVVTYNLDTRTQRFIPAAVDTESIQALALTPSRRYLAVAERAERGVVTIYDVSMLKRRKVLVSSDSSCKEVVSVAFSADGKMLAAQGGAPDWTLTVWLWEKAKVVASIRSSNAAGSPITQVLFSPAGVGESGGIVSVVGPSIFKMWRPMEGLLKPVPSSLSKQEGHNFTTHTWLTDSDKDRMVVGTAAGDLFLVEAGDVRATLALDPPAPVEAIAAHAKGFAVASDNGMVTLFEKEADERLFRRGKRLGISGQARRIRSLAVSPGEDVLLAALDNNLLYSLSLTSTDLMKVVGLGVAIRRPLVATCATDRSVSIWNFSSRVLELTKTFTEEPLSLSLHPSGYSLLVGFSDKLRLLTILMDDLRVVKELPIKACRECAFSKGGHLFAAANSTTVSIYNTYTCENIANLRAHNAKVRSLWWSPDDSSLVSAGADGAVYEWSLKDMRREKDNVIKCQQIYAVGSDRKLKEMEEVAGAGTRISLEFDAGVLLTQIALPAGARSMFCGTEGGAIRAYKFPLNGEYQELKCCRSSISRLSLSHDDSLLFAASEDGSLFVFDVKDKDPSPLLQEGSRNSSFHSAERPLSGGRGRVQVNEVVMQNEYALRLKEVAMNERVRELTDKFTAEIEADHTKFEQLMQDKNEAEMEAEDNARRTEERHQAQLAGLEGQYQAKLSAEVERYADLMREKEALNERWEQQSQLMVESQDRLLRQITEEYEAKLLDAQAALESALGERESTEREAEDIRCQMEEDNDRQLQELLDKYEGLLSSEQEVGLRLKGENGIMRKKFDALQKEIEEGKEEIRLLAEHKKDLYQQTISSLEKDMVGLRREIMERDETIGDKEKRIFDLKRKNQELEKFKFVLDYKINELKQQIDPKEAQIVSLNDQIQRLLRRCRRFEHDLSEVMEVVMQPAQLKEAVKQLYQKHVTGELKANGLDEDVQAEFDRQREYLERTVETMKRKLQKDIEQHKQDTRRILQENVTLLKEINELRREVKASKAGSPGKPRAKKDSPADAEKLRLAEEATASALQELAALQQQLAAMRMALADKRHAHTCTEARKRKRNPSNNSANGEKGNLGREGKPYSLEGLMRLNEMKAGLGGSRDAQLLRLEMQVAPRPISRERLPPLDHFPQGSGTRLSTPDKTRGSTPDKPGLPTPDKALLGYPERPSARGPNNAGPSDSTSAPAA